METGGGLLLQLYVETSWGLLLQLYVETGGGLLLQLYVEDCGLEDQLQVWIALEKQLGQPAGLGDELVVVHGLDLLLSGVHGPGGDAGAALHAPGDVQQERETLPS